MYLIAGALQGAPAAGSTVTKVWPDTIVQHGRPRKQKTKSFILPFIGLQTLTRPSVDRIFKGQLNPDYLLDAAISILLDGAYALLFLVHQDLFESPEDESVCGRTYGASRVAVVSKARYNPSLDYQ